MSGSTALELDALIFGGGAAGLWLLADLRHRGFSALLIESKALGAGQTIASQGILHAGVKYSLGGSAADSAKAVSEAAEVWRGCLAGQGEPDLRSVRVLSPCCYLWRTDSIMSRLGFLGAKTLLRTPVETVGPQDRPAILGQCPGQVLRVAEPVIDVSSFLGALAEKCGSRLICVKDPCDITYHIRGPGEVEQVDVREPAGDRVIGLRPTFVVLTAGEGNEMLRRAFGLSAPAMQRRALHMVMVRGRLPMLFGHCVDGDKTRVTITSATDSESRTVWHLGGEIAERGIDMTEADVIAHAKRELSAVLPGLDLGGTQWAAYRIDRAEGRTAGGRRPDGPVWMKEGNVISAWPTKLVLAPRLSEVICSARGAPGVKSSDAIATDFPRPAVAQPPWEVSREWHG